MDNPYKPRTRHLHKVEKLPGIAQAYAMVFKYSIFGSQSQSKGNFNDEKMEKEIKRKAVKKIVELWELSEIGEKVLMKKWVEKEPEKIKTVKTDGLKIKELQEFFEKNNSVSNKISNKEDEHLHGEWSELPILYDFDEEEAIRKNEMVTKSVYPNVEIIFNAERAYANKLNKIKPKNQMVKVTKASTIQTNRLYLDVTEIDYKAYVKTYKDIQLCREKLGLIKTDMKKGAPESIDSTRALIAAELDNRGVRRKEIAEALEFKIYSEDNPSGSYPLLHKYIQVGAQVRKKLDKLEKYLQAITGIK